MLKACCVTLLLTALLTSAGSAAPPAPSLGTIYYVLAAPANNPSAIGYRMFSDRKSAEAEIARVRKTPSLKFIGLRERPARPGEVRIVTTVNETVITRNVRKDSIPRGR